MVHPIQAYQNFVLCGVSEANEKNKVDKFFRFNFTRENSGDYMKKGVAYSNDFYGLSSGTPFGAASGSK
eukprot:SAG11_NODE_19083_length_474_cov_2.160000_2_plen_69_part_00